MDRYRYNQRVRVSTYLTDAEETAVKTAAAGLGMQVSQFLRELAMQYIEQNAGEVK